MKFKEYEYGFYGHVGSYHISWWLCAGCQNFIHNDKSNKNGYRDKPINNYTATRKGIMKQLPKIKDVVFIYGDYKDV